MQDGLADVKSDTAPVTVGTSVDSAAATAAAVAPPRRASPRPVLRPPSPPTHEDSDIHNNSSKEEFSASDILASSSLVCSSSCDLDGGDDRAPVAILPEHTHCVAVRCKSERSEETTAAAEGRANGASGAAGVTDEVPGESVEDLLGSLMRALKTDQGRADFGRLATGGVSKLPREG